MDGATGTLARWTHGMHPVNKNGSIHAMILLGDFIPQALPGPEIPLVEDTGVPSP